MASQPILVLIPGSFSWSHQYDALVQPLRAKGHVVHVLEPPCYPAGYKTNTENPLPSMFDDAKFINEFVSKQVDEEKQVVLLAHSYGGMSKTSTGPSLRPQHEELWTSENLEK
jgi:pimeloyl-ACP methyl ester carboxylesterase